MAFNPPPISRAMLGAGCISLSPILMTLANVGAVTVTFYRCALPLPVLAALSLFEQRNHGTRSLPSRGWAAAAGLFFAVNLVLWNHSIADVGAGIATVLGNLQIVFVIPFAWVFLREPPHRRYLIALPVVLVGIVMMAGVFGEASTGSHPVAGAIFGVGASAAYACFLLVLRQSAGAARHPSGQLFDATAGAAVGALLIGQVLGDMSLALPWSSLGWLLVLALSSGIVGWLLITSSLPHVPAGLSALLLLLEPAGAMILGVVILDQRPSLIQLAGAVLVCGSVVLAVNRSERLLDKDADEAPSA